MDTKKEFKRFDFFNFEEVEEYLAAQHKEGWKFAGAQEARAFTFEKGEPEDVTYKLDYDKFSKTDKMDEYVGLFSELGWEYVSAWGEYNVFRKKTDLIGEDEQLPIDNSEQMARMDTMMKILLFTVILSIAVLGVAAVKYAMMGRIVFAIVIAVMEVAYLSFVWRRWKCYKRAKK